MLGEGTEREGSTDTEGMNANVFECFEEQTDRRQFVKTREALKAYVKKNLKFAEDVSSLFSDDMEELQLEIPQNSTRGHPPLKRPYGTRSSASLSRERVHSKGTWQQSRLSYSDNAAKQ